MKGHFIGIGIGLNMFFAEYLFFQEPEIKQQYSQSFSKKKGRGYIK